jgi:hypothetical protein
MPTKPIPITEQNSRPGACLWRDLVWDGSEYADCGFYGPLVGYLHVPFIQDGETLRTRVRPALRLWPPRPVRPERIEGVWCWIVGARQ